MRKERIPSCEAYRENHDRRLAMTSGEVTHHMPKLEKMELRETAKEMLDCYAETLTCAPTSVRQSEYIRCAAAMPSPEPTCPTGRSSARRSEQIIRKLGCHVRLTWVHLRRRISFSA